MYCVWDGFSLSSCDVLPKTYLCFIYILLFNTHTSVSSSMFSLLAYSTPFTSYLIRSQRGISTQKLQMYDNRYTHTHIYHIYESAHIDNLNTQGAYHICFRSGTADNSSVYAVVLVQYFKKYPFFSGVLARVCVRLRKFVTANDSSNKSIFSVIYKKNGRKCFMEGILLRFTKEIWSISLILLNERLMVRFIINIELVAIFFFLICKHKTHDVILCYNKYVSHNWYDVVMSYEWKAFHIQQQQQRCDVFVIGCVKK